MGIKVNGRWDFEKCLTMIIMWQKQVVIKQKTKIHTEARYFALKLELSNTYKKGNIIQSSEETSFTSTLINGGS